MRGLKTLRRWLRITQTPDDVDVLKILGTDSYHMYMYCPYDVHVLLPNKKQRVSRDQNQTEARNTNQFRPEATKIIRRTKRFSFSNENHRNVQSTIETRDTIKVTLFTSI